MTRMEIDSLFHWHFCRLADSEKRIYIDKEVFMYNYRPPMSDEELDYLITYGTKEEIDEANERIISDMDDYCEYLVRMEEEKRIRKENNKM